MSRLTADFWVSAYRMRLEGLGIPCFVVKRGDASAGAVFVKVNTLDGAAQVWQRSFNLLSDRSEWTILVEGKEADCDASLRKQSSFDPDIWVLEVEDHKGRHQLDDPSLA